ncbi:TonB-dependent receptor plug domain-containing protein [Phenylobacterium sp. LjRoot225]|uniref:TonB-dependent receptor n=1 Tax=Phenylobacterium sp. LjRoot225 TaxID=3342285 RepID=UPI003ED144A6
MKRFMVLALASASFAALATSVTAQPAAAPAAAPADDVMLGEIVVTARRRSESLQQVPQSVTAVTADTLQKLNIQDFDDISSVTPGLSLSTGNNGYATAASTRGVSFQQETSASPTVAFYLNDAPVETPVLFQSMFDVGQVEVLRGPQGTVRGISSPSGAITLTTRRPDLSEYGGFVNATVTDLQSRNLQAAVNVPIIKDILGLRLAGVIDQNDFDGVRSVNNPLRPKAETNAIRASLAYEPSDAFNAYVSYMHLDRELQSYAQVAGAGQGYNGPVIEASDRLAVNDELSHIKNHVDVVTAQIDSRIWGQHLSYVGSYAFQKLNVRENVDRGNLIPNYEVFNLTYVPQERTTHEIRLASDPAPGRFLDYTVGAFYSWTATDVDAPQPRLLPGFFNPFAPDPAVINTRFQTTTGIISPSRLEETSFFGSLTAHFGEDTELTFGGRQIISRVVRTTNVALLPGGFSIAPPSALPFGGTCGPLPSTYPGLCDAPVPFTPLLSQARRTIDRPFIYNVSLSHRFSPDLLVYANHGTAWRFGPQVVGITNGADASGQIDPVLSSLSQMPNETSRSYEVGLKSTLLDGRMRFNVALFRQTFRNLFIRTEPVRYISIAGGRTDPNALFNFTTAVPATIEGFDIDTAFQITSNWNVTAALSYADGRINNGAVPCNGPIPTGQRIAICTTNASTSRDPLWNGTITSEYSHNVREGMEGFVRGLFQYYPENSRRSAAQVINPYSLLNLYAGLRSEDGAWEVAVFAKNAFKTDEVTSLDINPYGVSGSTLPFTTNYFGATYTPRREVGVNVRYAFGSR